MKKNLFALFFCASLGLFFTADSQEPDPEDNDGATAFRCWYTGWVLDRCTYSDYVITNCRRGYLTSCGFNP